MKEINKDILTVTEGIIGHQVNCKGVMGAGLALNLRNRYPNIFTEYKANPPALGHTQLVQVTDKLHIANIAGQDSYGVNGIHTNYEALGKALAQLNDMNKQGLVICLPYKLGAGLAGGDWNIIKEIIESNVPSAIICKYPGFRYRK
jgi:O-acetyl-ADP-ribose deacetylase (regulator of RNase III)